jgi:hypothetical protein
MKRKEKTSVKYMEFFPQKTQKTLNFHHIEK